MPYHIIRFEDTDLPILNPIQDHTPAPVASTLVPSINGAFDRRGSRVPRPEIQTIPVTGVAWGETTYIVDENGDFLVDEDGNYVIGGDDVNMLRAQVDDLADRVGQRGKLWRKRFDDNALQWKTVRFLNMPAPQAIEDRLFKAHITFEFQSQMAYWHAQNATTYSASAPNGSAANLHIESGGKTITDPVMTVTCTSGTITAFTVVCAPLGINFTWSGSYIATSDVLTIDCGEDEFPDGAEDAYYITKNSGHSIPGWLSIPAGNWTFVVTLTGGAGTVALTYYEQYA